MARHFVECVQAFQTGRNDNGSQKHIVKSDDGKE